MIEWNMIPFDYRYTMYTTNSCTKDHIQSQKLVDPYIERLVFTVIVYRDLYVVHMKF